MQFAQSQAAAEGLMRRDAREQEGHPETRGGTVVCDKVMMRRPGRRAKTIVKKTMRDCSTMLLTMMSHVTLSLLITHRLSAFDCTLQSAGALCVWAGAPAGPRSVCYPIIGMSVVTCTKC